MNLNLKRQKYEKIYYKPVDEIKIHELANLSPTMTNEQYEALKDSIKEFGQIYPAVLYKGLLIDGRHRLKALKELGIEKIKYKNENPQMTEGEVRDRILKVHEQRRHQTPTQKAIMAYREFVRRKKKGEKVTIGSIAKEFGSTRELVSRTKTLAELTSERIIEILFNGGKIEIKQPDSNYVRQTDSIITLVTYFKMREQEIIKESLKIENFDLTDNEKEFVDITTENLINTYNDDLIRYFIKVLSNKNKSRSEKKIKNG